MLHRVSCPAAFGIFPDQGSNLCPLHRRADSLPPSFREAPSILLLLLALEEWQWGLLRVSSPGFALTASACSCLQPRVLSSCFAAGRDLCPGASAAAKCPGFPSVSEPSDASSERKVKALVAQSCPTLWDPMDCIARQAPLSMGVSRQESWSGLPCPPPGGSSRPGD